MTSKKRTSPGVADLYKAIRGGDRSALARAITLSESTRPADRKKSLQLLRKLLPFTGKSIRIGVTGVPGVGKSTFIEAFGEMLTGEGKKVGVLTVDPTSQKTKGSILGDKTRMEKLSRNPNVFIRPSPTALALGGVTYYTREAILLCEAAGYDVILIETVGVGQSETIVRNMVDFFLLLVLTGAGDELQGIKKGIMEMADGIVVTKADGDNVKAAKQAQVDALQALHFRSSSAGAWKPKVLTISSVERKGLTEVWKMIGEFERQARANDRFITNRKEQQLQWLVESLEQQVKDLVSGPLVSQMKPQIVRQVSEQKVLPTEAAETLFWNWLGKLKEKR